MRRLAAAICFSTCRTSGRRSSIRDGSPAGTSGTRSSATSDAARTSFGVNTSRGERPVNTASADSFCAIRRSVSAMSEITAARSAFACDRSYSPMMPASARSVCSRTVSSRRARVSRNSRNCASAARSPKYARATSAATAVRTVSRAYCEASRSFCAASVAARYLPHKSTSYDAFNPTR